MRNPSGTAGSTAWPVRLQASPTPGTCLPAALDGSMGHCQDYRSITAAGTGSGPRVSRPASQASGERGSLTGTTRPGAA